MTPLAIPYPAIDPVFFTISLFGLDLPIRWYALAYLAGLLLGLWILRRLIARPALWPADEPPLNREQAESLLSWMVAGVILGGRLGFVIFYQPGYFMEHPAEILQVWGGGMSFHGGFLGVALAIILFSRFHGAPLLSLADGVAMAAPTGLLFGRLANFINGELWGRVSDVPWAMVFPGAGDMPRHPSQLYEAALEGALLFLVMWFFATRRGWLRRPGALTGLFLAGYGASRALVELFREPDAQFFSPENPYGHALRLGADYGLTMGQCLSLPMLAIGAVMIVRAKRG